jgi:hypothetical protein
MFGPQSGLHVLENKLMPLPGVEPRFLAQPARTVVTVLSPLCCLLGRSEFNHENLEQGQSGSESKFEAVRNGFEVI